MYYEVIKRNESDVYLIRSFLNIMVVIKKGIFIMEPTIIIDAGHGGFDNGASYEGRREKDDTLKLALAVGRYLREEGFPVVFTRESDIYQKPIDKASIANQSGGDYFVSIHRNASGTPNEYNGVQTLIYGAGGIAEELAYNINEELEKTGFNNINVEERKDLAVLRRTSMPAVLVEAGFINSDKDNEILDDNFDAVAKAIATGIADTVGATVSSRSSNPRAEKAFGVQIGLFRRYENAQYLLEEMLEQGFQAQIKNWNGYYAVVVGDEASIENAQRLERELNKRRYQTLIVNL